MLQDRRCISRFVISLRSAVTILSVLFLLGADVAAMAQEDAGEGKNSGKALQSAFEAVLPSMVTVEYTFQYDKGEYPQSNHGSGGYYATSVKEERPHLEAGYLASGNLVITDDLMVHPRFIEKIEVRAGDEVRGAVIDGVARGEWAVVLKLDKPFGAGNAVPLRFNAEAEGPYFMATQYELNGGWSTRMGPFSAGLVQFANGERIIPLNQQGPIVNKDGECVAVTMSHELPSGGDESWKGNPLEDWPLMGAGELATALDGLGSGSGAGVARVAMRFRSPRKTTANPLSYYDDDDDSTRTEWNGFGVVIDESNVLILADLSADATARLEEISLFLMQGDGTEKKVGASFRGSFKDYAALMATFDEPVSASGVVRFSTEADLTAKRDDLLLAARLLVRGETRDDYYSHGRFSGFAMGWKGLAYPAHPGSEGATFYFDPADGGLLTLPMSRRERLEEDRYGGYEDFLFPVGYLADVLADPEAFFDANNVPLSEEEENRIAWFGVELQPMDAELARFNEIADETDDGRFGAAVTHLYEGSPASKAGILVGDVLIRLHSDELPKPAEVDMSGDFWFAVGQSFPWEDLDQIPAEYFEQIPPPWSQADNDLNTTLTDIGFGSAVRMEFIRDGELKSIDFVIEESPDYYGSAPKFEDEGLGVTVRDLTYEVRRYFLKKDADAGVIVSTIEPGSKAAVAGLKPYEIVTAVNDEAVKSVEDFERLVGASAELKFSVTRMTRGRIVMVKRD